MGSRVREAGALDRRGVLAVLIAGSALPQGNIDAGKTPAQMFSDTCSNCHRRPRELKRGASASFLRQHYTPGAQEARGDGELPSRCRPQATRGPRRRRPSGARRTRQEEKAAGSQPQAQERAAASARRSSGQGAQRRSSSADQAAARGREAEPAIAGSRRRQPASRPPTVPELEPFEE